MGFRAMVRLQVRWDSPLHRLAALLVALSLGLLLVRVPPLLGVLLTGLVIVVVATLIEPLVGLGIGLFLSLLRAYLLTEAP